MDLHPSVVFLGMFLITRILSGSLTRRRTVILRLHVSCELMVVFSAWIWFTNDLADCNFTVSRPVTIQQAHFLNSIVRLVQE